MFKITLPPDRTVPDMPAVARAFGISMDDLIDGIAIGSISRWVEVGDDNEDNKPHQIFASSALGIRVDVDESGKVHSVGDYGNKGTQRSKSVTIDRSGEEMTENLAADRLADLDVNLKARLDALLDEALDQSFPASDPLAISIEVPDLTRRP